MQQPAAYALADRQVDVETPEHVSVGYELADLGSRFTAKLVDGLLLGLIFFGLFCLLLLLAATGLGAIFRGDLVIALFILVWFLASAGYYVFYEGFRDGQTPGKKMMRIRVVQDGGYPVSFRAAAVRNLMRAIDALPPPSWGVAALTMMLHPRTKRLGDIAAGTVVVRDRTGQPVPEERTAAGAVPMGRPLLADQEFAALSMYVQRRAGLEYGVRAQVAGTLMQRLAPRFEGDPRRGQMPFDAYLGTVYEEESARRRESGAGGRAGSPQATALFRRQKPMWDEYDRMLAEARRAGLPAMGERRVSRFAALYREVAADLARARTYGGSPELLFMLERAVGAGHNLLYSAPVGGWRGFRGWIMGGFPALVRMRWRPILLASVLLYLPAVLTFAAVRGDPAMGRRMLPSGLMQRAEEAESRRAAGKGYVSPEDFGGMPIMATAIMSNNVRVTFMAFAAGILAGLGTALVLVFNGVQLGAVAAVFANHQANLHFWSFVLPHGIIELTAICIAGGAGLWLGSAFLLPGRMTRREALVVRGREAVSLIGGTAVMLVVAGLIEGFISPSDLPSGVKLGAAAVTLVLLAMYLGFAGRGEEARKAAAEVALR
ncbi:MAG: stage II sporulation protein M [Longimicrobiaceae bacterium]